MTAGFLLKFSTLVRRSPACLPTAGKPDGQVQRRWMEPETQIGL